MLAISCSLKKVLYIALISLLWLSISFPVNGEIFGFSWLNDPHKLSTQSLLEEFLRADSGPFLVNESNIQQEFAVFVSKLEDRRSRYSNELDFLSYLYYKVHRKYLHRYHTPVSMNALFEKGRYCCLTGTALYALLFESLGMEYQIVETTYHIYLTLTVDGPAGIDRVHKSNRWDYHQRTADSRIEKNVCFSSSRITGKSIYI
ncbi:MAG: hypothetical protein OER04_10745 [Cyclobacteriaceae bacterium]|nr:hypothetical protein [Cyclobacteriaceae bacterium]